MSQPSSPAPRFSYSQLGQRLTGQSGILQLMDDIAAVLHDEQVCMLGGGNPAVIPAVMARYQQAFRTLCAEGDRFNQVFGHYASPAGDNSLLRAVATLLQEEYGWPVSEENICLSNGSQNAFFQLFNLFSGPLQDGSKQRILLPMAPEYLGYRDSPLDPDSFRAEKPLIEPQSGRHFKYRVDVQNVHISDDIGAVCVSRPTNPTGNVLTDDEVAAIDTKCRAAGVPFILDNAYGAPFPGIIHVPVRPHWNDNTVALWSLSKLGLPALRTGIVVAHRDIIRGLKSMNAIMNLSPASPGAAAIAPLFASREILRLSNEQIRPAYAERVKLAESLLEQHGGDLPLRIHQPEGAIFLWLWMPDLPIDTLTLYQRLKSRKVIIVPGNYFFPGIQDNDWRHQRECLRMSIAAPEDKLERGIAILCEEVRRAYDEGESGAPR